jgi:hypothetical protein
LSFVRPEILDALRPWKEVIGALCLAAFGLWVMLWGGYAFLLLGLAPFAAGVGWAVLALRRLRFAQTGEAPGIVRVSEGQVSYLGPRVGGFVGLPDLTEIHLLTLRGRRIWQLRQALGDTLHIPVEAAGAEALFDAFATLPGIDMTAVLAALGAEDVSQSRVVALNAVDRVVWTRTGSGIVQRPSQSGT